MNWQSSGQRAPPLSLRKQTPTTFRFPLPRLMGGVERSTGQPVASIRKRT